MLSCLGGEKVQRPTWLQQNSSTFAGPNPWLILLVEEILHHLLSMKPYEKWYILHINWCRIPSINSITQPLSSRRVQPQILRWLQRASSGSTLAICLGFSWGQVWVGNPKWPVGVCWWTTSHIVSSWWLNQPIWKILYSQNGFIFPK